MLTGSASRANCRHTLFSNNGKIAVDRAVTHRHAFAVVLNFLQVWTCALIVDAVLTKKPHGEFIHRLFLAPCRTIWCRNHRVTIIGMMMMMMKLGQDTLQCAKRAIYRRIELNGIYCTSEAGSTPNYMIKQAQFVNKLSSRHGPVAGSSPSKN